LKEAGHEQDMDDGVFFMTIDDYYSKMRATQVNINNEGMQYDYFL